MSNELVGNNEAPKERVSKWTKIAEFEVGKDITPLGFDYVSGETVKTKPEFCDESGNVYVLKYIDHDNADIERTFESKYPSLWNSAKYQKVERGKKYHIDYGLHDKEFKTFKWVRK